VVYTFHFLLVTYFLRCCCK